MKKIIFLLSVFLLVAVSCKRDDDADLSPEQLKGTWTWTQSIGGLSGADLSTPTTTGIVRTLEFTTDMTYTIRENGNIVAQGTYQIFDQKSIKDLTYKPFIDFSASQDMMVMSISASNLELSDNNYDGFSHSYVK